MEQEYIVRELLWDKLPEVMDDKQKLLIYRTFSINKREAVEIHCFISVYDN